MDANQTNQIAKFVPMYREFPAYDLVEFAKFVEDFGVDPETAGPILDSYQAFQASLDDERGEDNVGTFVEVTWSTDGEPVFSLGSYPLN